MGKKNKSYKNHRNSNVGSSSRNNPFTDPFSAMSHQTMREGMLESLVAMHTMANLPLPAQTERIRSKLIDIGTDCIFNDNDPMGDGDQSKILSSQKRDDARELYSYGGDINGYFENGAFTQFAMSCISGEYQKVAMLLSNITNRIEQPWCHNNEMKAILETRECSMRLSPLLLIVSAGKSCQGVKKENHVATAKILLKHGARPNAQDVLGKTVCHYGGGGFSTSMTLEVVDMCIRATETVHLYGKDVELFGLKAADFNGLKGVVGGFDPDSGRRSVYIFTIDKEVWIKPSNMQLLSTNDEDSSTKVTMLADIQDRFGSVALHEVIMSNKVDAARLLLRQHNASIHVCDLDGMSPMKMVPLGGMTRGEVAEMITAAARKEGAADRRAKKESQKYTCASCQKDLSENEKKTCSGCHTITYCSTECQHLHWKQGHKRECSALAKLRSGIRVDPAPPNGLNVAFMSKGGRVSDKGSYRKPRGVSTNEKFVIKVQAMSDMMPILIYDESRICQFEINPGQPGFDEILAETRKEMTWDGRKTFMKASFNESGKCIIYPATAGVKAKYSW